MHGDMCIFFELEAQVKWESSSELRPTPEKAKAGNFPCFSKKLSPSIEIYYFLLDQVLSWKAGSTFQQINWATNLNTEQAMQPPGILSLGKGDGQLKVPRGKEKADLNNTGVFSWSIVCLLFWLYPYPLPSVSHLHNPILWNRTF